MLLTNTSQQSQAHTEEICHSYPIILNLRRQCKVIEKIGQNYTKLIYQFPFFQHNQFWLVSYHSLKAFIIS